MLTGHVHVFVISDMSTSQYIEVQFQTSVSGPQTIHRDISPTQQYLEVLNQKIAFGYGQTRLCVSLLLYQTP